MTPEQLTANVQSVIAELQAELDRLDELRERKRRQLKRFRSAQCHAMR